MSKWNLFCTSCGNSKSKRAKRCRECYAGRSRRRKTLGVPTTVKLTDGSEVKARSKVEASWAKVFGNAGCLDSFHEDTKLFFKTDKGQLRSYTPDFRLETSDGQILCEIKSSEEACLSDIRPSSCVQQHPTLRFLCLGGRPHSRNGFTVRLISHLGEKVYTKATLTQLSTLLDCDLKP